MGKILTTQDTIFERATEFPLEEKQEVLTNTIEILKNFLLENPNIPSISAPQLDIDARIFCVNFNGDIRTFINPIISKADGLHLTRESCPSIVGKEFIVPRNDTITIIYMTPTGKPETNKLEGFASEIFQQQIQLLDGVLLSDFGLEITDEFENASEEEQKEVLELYIDRLKQENDELQTEINNDDELKQMTKAVEFMTKVQTGEVTLEKEDLRPKVKPKLYKNKRKRGKK